MSRGRQALLLAVVAISGAGVLVLELAAARLFAPSFGTSMPVWTNVLAVVLGALAAGYTLGGRMAARGPTLATPGWILLAAGVLAAGAAAVGPALGRSLLPEGADLEGLTAVLVRGSFLATLVAFGPPMVLLGAVGPLAVHLLAEGRPAGRAAGWVLSLSTLGSIVGTYLTTFVLLEHAGTRATVGGTGAALAVTGLLLVFADDRAARARAAAAVLLAAAGGLAAAAPAGEFRPAAPGTGAVLAEMDTAYQFLQVREVDDRGADEKPVPTRLLTMNEGVSTYHSVRKPGSVLTGGRYYDLYPALPLLLDREPGRPLEVLVLGLAAGTQARALRHFFGDGIRVDGVELDPAAVEAGRKWFDLGPEEPWLRVHAGDARAFLEAAPADRLWDLILVDCYGHEYYVPFHVATEEFFARARSHLRPGGVVAFNAFAYHPRDPLLRALENTAARAFGRAWRAPVAGWPNFVVLATRREGEVDLPLLHLAGQLDAAAAGKTPPALAAFAARPESGPVMRLAAQCLGAARAVPHDPAGVVLTDDLAPVERLTDLAIREYEAVRAGRRP